MDNADLKAPANVSSVTVDGKEYAVNKKGVVAVPADAVPFLVQQGFTPA